MAIFVQYLEQNVYQLYCMYNVFFLFLLLYVYVNIAYVKNLLNLFSFSDSNMVTKFQ